MWIRAANHHFNLDKVTYTYIRGNGELDVNFLDGTNITLRNEEAQQVLDYLDNISCPTWGLEVPEITKEYKES